MALVVVLKSIELKAVQWLGTNFWEIRNFCPNSELVDSDTISYTRQLYVNTPQGRIPVEFGGWIIKNRLGNYMVIGREQFNQEYSILRREE